MNQEINRLKLFRGKDANKGMPAPPIEGGHGKGGRHGRPIGPPGGFGGFGGRPM